MLTERTITPQWRTKLQLGDSAALSGCSSAAFVAAVTSHQRLTTERICEIFVRISGTPNCIHIECTNIQTHTHTGERTNVEESVIF